MADEPDVEGFKRRNKIPVTWSTCTFIPFYGPWTSAIWPDTPLGPDGPSISLLCHGLLVTDPFLVWVISYRDY
ncbi:hypothetical protein ACP70R_033211 [Stipagrostis hirtigluma subsp. patula]